MASPSIKLANDSRLGVVPVRINFTSGASGAVPTTLHVPLVRSVAISGTTYTVTMEETWLDMMAFEGCVVQASFATSGAMYAVPLTVTVATDKKITFSFNRGDTGAAVAPASGDLVKVKFDLVYLRGAN